MAAVLAPIALGHVAAAQGLVDVGSVAMTPAAGGSSTPFSLGLPKGAACPGDSANDGYRVQSYMVPSSVDPTTVTYDGTGPVPYAYGSYSDFRQPLYDIKSNSFVSGQTADATAPGQPGPIINVPTFDFAVYGAGQLPPGRYHLGIACTLRNEITTVWDTQVVVTKATDDEPGQIAWTVAEGEAGSGGAGSGPPAVAILALGLVAVTGVTYLIRRARRAQPTNLSLEDA